MPPTHKRNASRAHRNGRLQKPARREIFIHAGRVVVRARLLDTPTAGRIWQTLPIYSTAETWGEAVHFETHAETGREAHGKSVSLDEVCRFRFRQPGFLILANLS